MVFYFELIMSNPTDSKAYLEKKSFLNSVLTVYGRKPVLEALSDPATRVYRLHLASSNKSADILDQIIALASKKNAEIVYHDRMALSRISKNAKQDQGVAVDLICDKFQNCEDFLINNNGKPYRLLALDGITNPQNIGMIIRSACAGNIDGIILPQQGTAQIDPLVIKASAGTVFKAPLLRCNKLIDMLKLFAAQKAQIVSLSSHAKLTLKEYPEGLPSVFVLGNETEGVSKDVEKICTHRIRIPMNNGVESLNVAVTAALIAFNS